MELECLFALGCDRAILSLSTSSMLLDPELDVLVGESRVNYRAFADDIALIARTPGGLQFLLNVLATEFQLCGMEISAGLDGKSASLRIDVDGKRKEWIVNPHPHLLVFGYPIPAIDITKVQKYLGTSLSNEDACGCCW